MPGLPTASSPSRGAAPGYSPVSALEFSLLVIVLLIFSEGILPRLLSGDDTVDGSPLLRMVWLPIYVAALAGLIWKARDAVAVGMRLPFLLGLLLICMASFAWSIDPGLSQRRGFAILMTSLAGLYLGTRYSWKTMLRVIALTWFILALTSFFTGLLNPSFGRMQEVHQGAWQGLYFEKNQ